MIEDQNDQIYEEFIVEETDELLYIWQYGDIEEWNDIDFEIIKAILIERLGYVPPQSIELQLSKSLNRIEDYLENNELEKALSECELAIQLKQDFAIPYNYQGIIYDEMGQLEKAILNYQKAVELAPGFEEAWENLRSVEAALKEDFEGSLAKKHLDQAREYVNQGETTRAYAACELAKETIPPIAFAYNELGLVFETLGRLDLALNAYQKAIQLNSERKEAWKNLKRIEVDLEKEFYESATIQHLDQALEYANDGEFEKAKEECETAKSLLPDLALAYNYLGLILHTLDQLEPAIDSYLKAIQFNPRFYVARENLATAKLAWEEEQYHLFSNLNQEEEENISFDEFQMLITTEPIPSWFYTDENALLLPGWAGHRTRQGEVDMIPWSLNLSSPTFKGVLFGHFW
ncbi:MAG: tetratricopeptide repeat protein [Anaerolineales bacterium]|nr:tetratricopeptide repeat protein [Anaerolineales bacterium]